MKTYSMFLAVSAVAMLLALSGCGQTGPLYLPDETEKVEKK
jgi:predicted small lipoprotein YifL